MITITATQKSTNANTLYYSINAAEKRHLLNILTEFVAVYIEYAQHDKELRTALWHPAKDLPRGKEGLNSPISFAAGIIRQHIENPRHDFSSRQLDGIDLMLPNLCSAVGCELTQIRRV